ncbi:hypothetical protein Scep_027769 [Stephania cephalantha]|uniref:Uncharacterized protein n=1 Tax=Stephania cephalantha TaxID=152367 RepID=A0AAP0EBY1_9MAGN
MAAQRKPTSLVTHGQGTAKKGKEKGRMRSKEKWGRALVERGERENRDHGHGMRTQDRRREGKRRRDGDEGGSHGEERLERAGRKRREGERAIGNVCLGGAERKVAAALGLLTKEKPQQDQKLFRHKINLL